MSSVPPILEGTLSGTSFNGPISGGVHGSHDVHGSLHGSHGWRSGSLSGDAPESPEAAAVAELGGLISSLGSLAAQAQSLPLSPPEVPGLPQSQGYRPQVTDYSLGDDAN
jgi:hypothetical protein